MKDFMKIMGVDLQTEKFNLVDAVVYSVVLFVTFATVILLAGVLERWTA